MLHNFVSDLIEHLKNYYTDLVDLTPKIIMAVVVFMISWFIAGRIQVFSGNRLRGKMHDPLLANFLSRLFRAIFMVIAFLVVLNIIGLKDFATSLAAGAGISAFVVGFALKDIGENFLAGILLAFKRPFAIGEIIESGGIKGTVVELNLRDTQVRSAGKNIYIPNALLVKNVLINYSQENYLYQDLQVNIDTSAKIDLAISTVLDVLKSTNGILKDKGRNISAQASAISGNGVTISISYWIRTDSSPSDSEIKSNVILKIMDSFQQQSIPLPTNTVEIKQSPLS
ncbi:mechanosensitive ion channel family protein [Flavobacterium silvaticum]|uniref:Mechanosensitive ion channel n=1 Tax=Flavobacterium silvaticum TaxID=1852020 RepID=A0A972JHX6_9FLAO|nr:mechanosensitive ion channel domain-containing protein [Flavobacterium silvaticum]NMH27598.1 mechanosensitive ion channel [Flavobacterium silvaticum]